MVERHCRAHVLPSFKATQLGQTNQLLSSVHSAVSNPQSKIGQVPMVAAAVKAFAQTQTWPEETRHAGMSFRLHTPATSKVLSAAPSACPWERCTGPHDKVVTGQHHTSHDLAQDTLKECQACRTSLTFDQDRSPCP